MAHLRHNVLRNPLFQGLQSGQVLGFDAVE